MSAYTRFFRPLLFGVNAEVAHQSTIEACRLAARVPGLGQLTRRWLHVSAPELQVDAAGLHFENPIGLAAGWDKSGRAVHMLPQLGFGFAEIGSVSARPSRGNPKPRLFRLPQDRALLVNYGLPNDGAAKVMQRVAAYRRRATAQGVRVPIGLNLVKTNDGPEAPACSDEEIVADYLESATLLHPHADYLTLNLSCPNAEGGQSYFARAGTTARLLEALRPLRMRCPVFLKVAPVSSPAVLERLITEAEAFDFVRGFIFNLPPSKPESVDLRTPRERWQHLPGALAGKPVEQLINRCIAELYRRMPPGRFIIIGAGGVFTAEDAYTKIRLGASLVQIYSAFVYEGPAVVKRINEGLCELLNRDGFQNVQQAVGTAETATDTRPLRR